MRKTDLPDQPEGLFHQYALTGIEPVYCEFCKEKRVDTSHPQECPIRLRDALNAALSSLEETQSQFSALKADVGEMMRGTCDCVQIHAPTCKAIPRPIDLAAPWVGMRFWCSMPVNGWTECQVVQTTRGVIYFSPVARPNEGHSLVRTIWDHNVTASQIKTVKP